MYMGMRFPSMDKMIGPDSPASGPILTIASAFGQVVRKYKNLQDH